MSEVALDVVRERPGGRVAPPRVLLQAPVHDPRELAPQQAPQRAGVGAPAAGDLLAVGEGARPQRRERPRLLLAQDAHQLDRVVAQALGVEGQAPGQQLVEHDAERVDVGGGADRGSPRSACSGAM